MIVNKFFSNYKFTSTQREAFLKMDRFSWLLCFLYMYKSKLKSKVVSIEFIYCADFTTDEMYNFKICSILDPNHDDLYGYPQRMRLQRRFFLIFMILSNQKLVSFVAQSLKCHKKSKFKAKDLIQSWNSHNR